MAELSESQLSFSRYVQAEKRAAEARVREGAAYAYGPELRTRNRLGRVRPVVLALEMGLAEFQKTGRAHLLEGAVEVASGRFAEVGRQVAAAARTLGLDPPRVFISPTVGIREACVFGTAEEAMVVLPAAFVDHLSASELSATVASALGRIHNQHTPLLTTLWVLDTSAPAALRWVGKSAAVVLGAWAQGADVTADRAALLVTRNLNATAGALAKRLGGGRRLLSDIRAEDALAHVDSLQPHPAAGLDAVAWTLWRRRVKAMSLFMETAFYRGGGAPEAVQGEAGATLTLSACNDIVSDLLGAS